jgi:acetyl esterase/lipase
MRSANANLLIFSILEAQSGRKGTLCTANFAARQVLSLPASRPYGLKMPKLPSSSDLLNALTPRGSVRERRDIAYGPHPRQQIDIYLPASAKNPLTSPLPVVIFFYGGSWRSGARAEYRFVGRQLARQGYIVAVPDYRLYPEVRYPDFIDDAAMATAKIAEVIPSEGGDPSAIFTAGHSAGAYLALMLALAPDYLAAAGYDRGKLAGAIGLAGPYDFLPITGPTYKLIFAPAPDLVRTQPIAHVDPGAPPCLLLQGARDTLVAPKNTASLSSLLRAAGTMVQSRIYPNIGHITILLALLPWFAWRAPVMADINAFIDEVRAADLSLRADPAHDLAGRTGSG